MGISYFLTELNKNSLRLLTISQHYERCLDLSIPPSVFGGDELSLERFETYSPPHLEISTASKSGNQSHVSIRLRVHLVNLWVRSSHFTVRVIRRGPPGRTSGERRPRFSMLPQSHSK